MMPGPIITADPDTLTLSPGESAQVTVTVDPASPYGIGSVTIPVEVPPPYDGTIEGSFGGLIPNGEHWHVTGDVNQTSDVFVEGLLTGIDSFYWQGNGFSVFFQNGGRPMLAGKFKAPWGPWGTDATGWLSGDRLAIAPTAQRFDANGKRLPSDFLPIEGLWTGDWPTLIRPDASPDVLVNGVTALPEVVNVSQSIVFENLARGFHIHDSGGVQTLSDVKFLNCGTTGVLGNYPIHFHMVGDNSRGSTLTRVVVEGGKNHAFVPHGSHGISLIDCAAYNTKGNAYWWDLPAGNPLNKTNDLVWRHCLSLGSFMSPAEGESFRITGFSLGAGSNLSCINCVAVGTPGTALSGGRERSGFHWPANVVDEWIFQNCVAHNNAENGIFAWQNGPQIHVVEDFTAYHNGFKDINHGAYNNNYRYLRANLTGGGVLLHAKSPLDGELVFEDILTDTPLVVTKHQSQSMQPVFFRRCTFTGVVYQEGNPNGSYIVYEDCGLVPSDFQLTGPTAATSIALSSIIEIKQGGVPTDRWQSGVWS